MAMPMKEKPRMIQHDIGTRTRTRTAALLTVAAGFVLLGGVTYGLVKLSTKSARPNKNATTTTVNANTNASAAVAGTWENINPGGGGEFTSIEAGPTGVIIAASDLSGAYRSNDRGATWDVIGSYRGLREAHVGTVAFDPNDPQIIYLGTEYNIYRSNNGGDTFTRPTVAGTSNFVSGYVAEISPAPSNPAVVYAGVHSEWKATDTTVYKSTDRGLTWTAVSTGIPDRLRVLKLLVDPLDENVVYLLSGWDRFTDEWPPKDPPEPAQMAVYKSTDAGVTWTKITEGVGDVWDFALGSANNATALYLTTYIPDCGDANSPVCPTDPTPCTTTDVSSWRGCTYRSDDGGQTWVKKRDHANSKDHTGAIFVRRDNPNVVRTIDIQRETPSQWEGVWESSDGGSTWTQKSKMADWESGWQHINWAYGRNYQGLPKTLGIDWSNSNVMLIADTQFIFAAFDGARFKQLFTNQVPTGQWRGRRVDNVAVMSFAQSETNPQRLYAGSYDLGIWRSDNGGDSWRTMNPLATTGEWEGHGGNTTSIIADPTRPDVVWVTSGETNELNGLALIKSTDGGENWTGTQGLPTGFIYGLSLDRNSPSSNRTLFVTANGDVYRSTDDGSTWTMVKPCFNNRDDSEPKNDKGCWVTAVDRFRYVNPEQPVVYVGGECTLQRSLDGGTNWQSIGDSRMFDSSIKCPPASPNYTLNEKTRDHIKWTGIHSIVPDPKQRGRVYVVAYSVDGSGSKGLFRSDNADAANVTWTLVRSCKYCRQLAIDPQNPDTLYLTSSQVYKSGGKAADSVGIQRSTDGGATWTAWNEGLAWPFAGPIVISPDASKIFVGAPGTGYFRRTLITDTGGGDGDPGLVIPKR